MKTYKKYKIIVSTKEEIPSIVFVVEAGRPGLVISRWELEGIAKGTMERTQLDEKDYSINLFQEDEYIPEDGDEEIAVWGKDKVSE